MNQTTQTRISYKKKKNQICKKPKNIDLHTKKKKNPNLHDIGGDLQNFCMTGPNGRDLYKTYPDLQSLGKKKNKKPDQQTQIAILVLDLQWRDAISGVEDCVIGGCFPCQAWERVRSGLSM